MTPNPYSIRARLGVKEELRAMDTKAARTYATGTRDKLYSYIREHNGEEYLLPQLAGIIGCSTATIYKYINELENEKLILRKTRHLGYKQGMRTAFYATNMAPPSVLEEIQTTETAPEPVLDKGDERNGEVVVRQATQAELPEMPQAEIKTEDATPEVDTKPEIDMGKPKGRGMMNTSNEAFRARLDMELAAYLRTVVDETAEAGVLRGAVKFVKHIHNQEA